MKVRDIMAQPVIVAREDASLEEIAKTMLDCGIGAMPVVNEKGELTGIITESDFTAKNHGIPFSSFRAPQLLGHWLTNEGVERIYEAAKRMTANEIMCREVLTVTEDESVERLLGLMVNNDLKRIPVVRDGVPVGIVARHDILKMMLEQGVKTP